MLGKATKWSGCGDQKAFEKVKPRSEGVQERSAINQQASTQEPSETFRTLHGRRRETPYIRVHA